MHVAFTRLHKLTNQHTRLRNDDRGIVVRFPKGPGRLWSLSVSGY